MRPAIQAVFQFFLCIGGSKSELYFQTTSILKSKRLMNTQNRFLGFPSSHEARPLLQAKWHPGPIGIFHGFCVSFMFSCHLWPQKIVGQDILYGFHKCRADHWWKHPMKHFATKTLYQQKGVQVWTLRYSLYRRLKKREQIFCRCRRSWAVSNGHRLCHQIVAIQGAIGETNEATGLVGSEQFNEMTLPLDPSKPWFICF